MEDIKKKIMKINRDEAVELLGFICGYHKIRCCLVEEKGDKE